MLSPPLVRVSHITSSAASEFPPARDQPVLGPPPAPRPAPALVVDDNFDVAESLAWESLLKMEFKKFLQVWLLLPCQILSSGRRLIYRVLTYNEWVPVLLRSVELLRRLRLT
jgi:hypothetical protein